MKKLVALSALFAVFLSPHVYAAGCAEQASALTDTAAKEWKKVKKNMEDMMPEPSDYSKIVKDCIGSLGDWVFSIGFKMPSIEELLRMLCKEIKSRLEIPELDFKFDKQFGFGSHVLYEVDHRRDAEDVFAEIWAEIWR